MPAPLPDRYGAFHAALAEGLNAKLTWGNPAHAARPLAEAHEIATGEDGGPPLAREHQAEAAYRLAVARLRSLAKLSEAGNDRQAAQLLTNCDALLTKATRPGGEALAPWPRIYRTAVLIRLERLGQASHRTVVQCWADLSRGLELQAAQDAAKQSLGLNLLEVLGIAGGLTLEPLIGLGVHPDHLDAALLDGTRRDSQRNRSWSLAVAEAEHLSDEAGTAAFRIDERSRTSVRFAGGEWTDAGPRRHAVWCLAWLMGHSATTLDALDDEWQTRENKARDVRSEAKRQARLRKLHQKLRDLVEELAGPGEDHLGRSGDHLALGSGARVWGVVHHDFLRRARSA